MRSWQWPGRDLAAVLGIHTVSGMPNLHLSLRCQFHQSADVTCFRCKGHLSREGHALLVDFGISEVKDDTFPHPEKCYHNFVILIIISSEVEIIKF